LKHKLYFNSLNYSHVVDIVNLFVEVTICICISIEGLLCVNVYSVCCLFLQVMCGKVFCWKIKKAYIVSLSLC